MTCMVQIKSLGASLFYKLTMYPCTWFVEVNRNGNAYPFPLVLRVSISVEVFGLPAARATFSYKNTFVIVYENT